jgi:hypothetical protein
MKDRDDTSQQWQLQEVLTMLSERVTELENALLGDHGIILQSGEASLSLKKDGSVDIRGKDLNLVGSGSHQYKGEFGFGNKGPENHSKLIKSAEPNRESSSHVRMRSP